MIDIKEPDFYFKLDNEHITEYLPKIEELANTSELVKGIEVTKFENHIGVLLKFDSLNDNHLFLSKLNKSGVYFTLSFGL